MFVRFFWRKKFGINSGKYIFRLKFQPSPSLNPSPGLLINLNVKVKGCEIGVYLIVGNFCNTNYSLFARFNKNCAKIKWLGINKFAKIAKIKCREISPFTNCVCVSYCGACRWIVVWRCRRTFMCAEAKIILRGNSKHPLFAPIRPSANLRAFLCFPLSKFPDWKGLSYSFPATKVIPSFFCTARQHRPNELALTPTRWFRFCICKCLEHQKPPLYQCTS